MAGYHLHLDKRAGAVTMRTLATIIVALALMAGLAGGDMLVRKVSQTFTDPDASYLLARYWFDPTATNGGAWAEDSSGNGYGATNMPNYATGPTWTIVGTNDFGRVEHAYSYDDVNDYHKASNIQEIDDATKLSLVAWVKLADLTSGDNYVVCQTDLGDGVLLFKDDVSAVSGRTDIWRVYLAEYDSSTIISIESPTDGATTDWQHIVATIELNSATGLRLYINAVEVPDSPVNILAITSIDAGANLFSIGSLASSPPNHYMHGLIDDVRVYTGKILSAAAITNLFLYTDPENDIEIRP